MTVDLREYVAVLVAKIEAAGERGDKAEAIRLLRLLRDEAEAQAAKLERQ